MTIKPLRTSAPHERRWRWARHVEQTPAGLRCPCCSMMFGDDEILAASVHVVHAHPMPDDLDAAIKARLCTDAELDLLELERVARMTPEERRWLESELRGLEREAEEARKRLGVL